jgi:hypothetical protein
LIEQQTDNQYKNKKRTKSSHCFLPRSTNVVDPTFLSAGTQPHPRVDRMHIAPAALRAKVVAQPALEAQIRIPPSPIA